ncbi:MAG: MFS transporter [Oscillospiraceae bacterium]|nr:MFS transporter [Oscillospiraceae bacterium]
MKTKIREHYHWVIAALAFLKMFFYGGMMNNLTMFLVPITESLDISRGSYSIAMSIRAIVNILSNLTIGFFFQHFGYRKSTPFFITVTALGLFLSAAGKDLLTLCLGAALIGTANAYCFSNGSSYILSKWFHKHYGLVMGALSSATGLGGGIFAVVLAKIITNYGWRTAYVTMGCSIIVMAVVVFLLARNDPKDMGLKPYGEGVISKKKAKQQWEGFGFDTLKKMPSFYLMLLATFLGCLCYYTASSVLTPYLQDSGMDLTAAASVNSILLFALVGTKFGCGWLSDRLGAKKVITACVIAACASLLMLANVTNYLTACCVALMLSVAAPLTGLMAPLLARELFGYQVTGTGTGIIIASIPASNMVAQTLANVLYDTLGSYKPIFWIMAIVTIGCAGLYLALFAMAKRDRMKFESQSQQEIEPATQN